jgi:hypothetical protein
MVLIKTLPSFTATLLPAPAPVTSHEPEMISPVNTIFPSGSAAIAVLVNAHAAQAAIIVFNLFMSLNLHNIRCYWRSGTLIPLIK